MDYILIFIAKVRTFVPGDVGWITFAVEGDFAAFQFEGDQTKINVAIGNLGTGTFTIAEAKAADDTVVRRVAASCMGYPDGDIARGLQELDMSLQRAELRKQQLEDEANTLQIAKAKLEQLADKRAE